MDDECPSCGGPMEPLRERHIGITLSGDEGADALAVDDDAADIIAMVCADCGYREEAEYRGEDGDEKTDD